MSDDPGEQKKQTRHAESWLALGVAFGAAFGAAWDDVGSGVALGTVFGLVIGDCLDARARKRAG